MKRLVFCFDGAWNKLNVDTPTNVVLTAASIVREAKNGVSQVIHYDEGVGTGKLTHYMGGIFGSGLLENIREAYRFLIFNYDPGDEIFVFGFSRGAFSARSFVGLIRCVGPLRRLHVGHIDDAINLYKNRLKNLKNSEITASSFRARYSDNVCIGLKDDEWRCGNIKGYISKSAPIMRIKYLGLWDTVGALGVPQILPGSGWINRRLKFHDVSLDGFVEYARHAVALDEMRKLFPPELFADQCIELNIERNYQKDSNEAPYQERWFPGVHGSVGGGGNIRGLSDGALHWVLKGAQKAGLVLDTAKGTRIDGFKPNPLAPLNNVRGKAPHKKSLLKNYRVGLSESWQLSQSSLFRWQNWHDEKTGVKYEPKILSNIMVELKSISATKFTPPTDLIATEIVKYGDNLSGYARKYYDNACLWNIIYEANRDRIFHQDDIFPGQRIRIPRHVNPSLI